jgi:hypothetical protein
MQPPTRPHPPTCACTSVMAAILRARHLRAAMRFRSRELALGSTCCSSKSGSSLSSGDLRRKGRRRMHAPKRAAARAPAFARRGARRRRAAPHLPRLEPALLETRPAAGRCPAGPLLSEPTAATLAAAALAPLPVAGCLPGAAPAAGAGAAAVLAAVPWRWPRAPGPWAAAGAATGCATAAVCRLLLAPALLPLRRLLLLLGPAAAAAQQGAPLAQGALPMQPSHQMIRQSRRMAPSVLQACSLQRSSGRARTRAARATTTRLARARPRPALPLDPLQLLQRGGHVAWPHHLRPLRRCQLLLLEGRRAGTALLARRRHRCC